MIELAIGTLGLGLLVLPGWLLARAHRLQLPALAGLLGGGLVLLTLVLGLQLAGLPLRAFTLGPGWLAWIAIAGWGARRVQSSTASVAPTMETVRPPEPWPWLFAAPVIAAAAYRVVTHPLFGTDTHFRWGYLATQMWSRGNLSYYPPVSPADFAIYAWPDGIPPLVSSITFALYCLTGGIKPAVTSPMVLIQFVLLLAAAGMLARKLFSPGAGAWAIVLLGVTPLAAWASVMGQETGFTALALAALFVYLPANRDEETLPAMIAAGIAVATAAVAREYGWAFVGLGIGLAWQRGLSGRGIAALGGIAAVTALPWYVRNAILTGNPIYNHSVGGLFPVNEAHAGLMALYREEFGFLLQLGDWGSRPFLTAVLLILAAVVGTVRYFRAAWPLVLAMGIVALLWIAAVPYTAAGFMYALRVLNPALVLGAAIGGAVLAAEIATPRRRQVALALFALAGLDAALRTLVLPDRPYRRAPAAWFTADRMPAEYESERRQLFAEIASHVGEGRLLALSLDPLLVRSDLKSVPPWSPDAAVIFDSTLRTEVVWQRLSTAGFTHVLIAKGELNRRYLAGSPAFAEATARNLRLVMNGEDHILFAIVIPRAEPPP